LREGLRQAENELNLKKGYLVVLVARTACLNAKSTHVSKDLIRAFKALDMTYENEKNT
jgi:RNase P protein component